MARPLVIVESPAKAKTIARFLGDDFDVRASVGHVADLPSKGLAVDVDNGFKPTYELTTRGRDVVKDLRAALKDASELYLATDEDREGEAISWHLLEHLKPRVPVKRMVFHEITRSAIEQAVANPRGIDYGLVDAAETRRVLDRLYGYEVSPVLWRRINRGLSAGRVQSPMIRLIVERERERMAFVAAGYWDVDATFDDGAVLHGDAGRTRRPQGRHRPGLRARRPGRRQRGRARRARRQVARRQPAGLDVHRPQRRGEGLPQRAAGAVHDLHPAAGGRPQAPAVGAAGDAGGAGPVRAGLHHLHAHRLDRAVRHRHHRRPVAGDVALRARVPVARRPAAGRGRSRTPRRRTRPSVRRATRSARRPRSAPSSTTSSTGSTS